MTVIDANNAIVGRLAAKIAPRLMKREKIEIINADKAVFTGRKEQIFAKYVQRTSITAKGNPEKGPKFSRMPDQIFKRAVRGMLTWKSAPGKAAYKNLRVHIGVPEELATAKAEIVKEAENNSLKKVLTVGELSKSLGAKW
ncbi:MAG: 50S ribosomal protein L13 [Candidatus Diapherotrites archaeon CG11_big_fil_rev_8_21_14_0_20_37_9]|nr:MAG: 50S ribosomal protein L13 [Candidatus Diapherotrites archaeon CG11_big_fil_rev_8_21_14_0_20_37_9]